MFHLCFNLKYRKENLEETEKEQCTESRLSEDLNLNVGEVGNNSQEIWQLLKENEKLKS